MRVYKIEFEGYELLFSDDSTAQEVVDFGFAQSVGTLTGLWGLNDAGDTVTVSTIGIPYGWDRYPTMTITAVDGKSYDCNCCKQEVPGDGFYNICHLCGWENEPGEGMDDDYGPNHMTLREGQKNYAEHGWYSPKGKE